MVRTIAWWSSGIHTVVLQMCVHQLCVQARDRFVFGYICMMVAIVVSCLFLLFFFCVFFAPFW